MGKLNQGILGGFSGAVGTVVGSTNRKGEDIIRARSKKARPASSAGQVKQQTKFGMVTGFMQGVNPVLKTGLKYCATAEGISPYNYACKHALVNAIAGTDESPELDYGKILLSSGSHSRIPGAAAAVLNNNEVVFSWSDSTESLKGEPTDTVCLVVYNVSNSELSFSTDAIRSEKTASIPVPFNTAGDTLLFYLFFRSPGDPLQVSTSQYLGSAEIV